MKEENIKSLTIGGFLKRYDLTDKITRRRAEHLLVQNVSSKFIKKTSYSYRIKIKGFAEFLRVLLEFVDTTEGKKHYSTKKSRIGRNRDFKHIHKEIAKIGKCKGLELVSKLDAIVLKYKIRPLELITKVHAVDLTHRNTKFYTLYKGSEEATQKGRDELNINDTKHEYILNNRKLYYRNK